MGEIESKNLFLLLNLSLLLSLSSIYFILSPLRKTRPLLYTLFTGFLFGGITILCIIFSIPFGPGVRLDLRNVVAGLGGLFGGLPSALISALLSSAYRAYLGGGGAFGGIVAIFASSLLGSLFHKLLSNRLFNLNPLWLLLFGTILTGVTYGTFLLIKPLSHGIVALKVSGFSFFWLTPLSTLIGGLLLRIIEENVQRQKEIKQKESNLRLLTHQIHNGIIVLDKSGKVLFSNPQGEKILKHLTTSKLLSLIPQKNLEIQVGNSTFQVKIMETIWDDINCFVFSFEDITERKKSEELFFSLLENSPSTIYIVKDGKFFYVNKMMEILSGYTKDELIGKEANFMIIPSDRDYFKEEIKRTLKKENFSPVEVRAQTKSGEIRWCIIVVRPFVFLGEEVLIGSFIDITEKKFLELSSELYRVRLFQSTQLIYKLSELKDENEVIETLSEGLKNIFNADCEFLASEEANEFQIRLESRLTLLYSVKNVGILKIKFPSQPEERDYKLMELILNFASNILNQISLQKELEKMALTDALTGLYNRHFLFLFLEQEVKRAQRYGRPIGFLIVDVNNMKVINDEKGHLVGDEVLKQTAHLLKTSVRESDIVVRYGGDEFLVLVLEPNNNGGLQKIKERILEKVDEYNSQNPSLPISLSIGFSLWDPQKGEPIDKALDEADRNMYLEKLRYYSINKNIRSEP